ncbi:MAG: family 10 glycosylhydrolase [Paludibacteraceae bacterium]|nr:family 10 glycosylhydrolase [Paludibacteraceae bacterium]
MKRIVLLILVAATFCQIPFAQPKRELRAAWIATVANIDWPSREAVGHTDLQKQEMTALLDTLQSLNMNAVVFQVRPTADALYYSDLEPLSSWLTGKQGRDNDVPYDVLEFVCHEAHKRCLDVHVWLNPYRVTNGQKLESLADSHIYRRHPEWFVQYGDKWYFDPALPQTRDFLNSVVADIVTRYDVDAIHFDDYFYPYKISGKQFPDDGSFAAYPRGFTDKEEWRRDNVNLVIEQLQTTIKSIKPWVEFGISPFGVWRNIAADPDRGSLTKAGCQNYDDLYADILLWLERGWIDYVVPQLYWEIGKRVADYEVLARWWAKYSYGRNLYIGQAPYQLGNPRGAEAWRTPNEICRQIRLNRTINEVQGSVYFSMRSLVDNKLGICDSLRSDYYRTYALPPAAVSVEELSLPPVDIKLEGHVLSWQSADTTATTHRYAVYGFPIGETVDFDNPQYILSVTAADSCLIDEPDRYSTLCVTEINRFKQESAPCILEN